MKSSALRVEFVISGAAFLGAVYALWLAVRRLLDHPSLRFVDWLNVDPTASTAAAVLFTAAFFAASFATGALIVQLTFEWPGRKLQALARRKVVRTLICSGRLYHEHRDDPQSMPSPDTREIAWLLNRAQHVNAKACELLPVLKELIRWPGRREDLSTSVTETVKRTGYAPPSPCESPPSGASANAEGHQPLSASDSSRAMELLLGAGWQRLTPDAAREAEYRRSNRQIFLGLLPAVFLGILAALTYLAAAYAVVPAVIVGVLCLALSFIGGLLAYRGAEYQEQRIAALLILAAILHTEATHHTRVLPNMN